MEDGGAADAAGHREEHLVIDRGTRAEPESIACAPDDRAGLDIDRGEGAVAGRDIEQLADAL